MAHIILFIISTLFILLSYVIFFSSKFETRTDIFIAGFTLASFQIIAVELLLGMIGLLATPFLVAFNLIVSASLIFISLKEANLRKFAIPIHPGIKSMRTIFILEMLIISYGFIAFSALIIPPYAWDSLTYHLVAPFAWIKAKRLILVRSVPGSCFFPMNGELIMTWIYLLSRNMNLLNLVQMPFALFLALSTYSLAKKLNINSAPKVIPIVLLTPVVMLLCSIEYTDVIFACFTIVALNFVIGYAKEKRTIFFLLSCIAVGLTGGVKPAGLFTIVASAGLLAFAGWRKISVKFLILGFLLIIVAGGFWYIRNFVLTSNPFFPYSLNILDFKLFKGVSKLVGNVYAESWFVKNKWEWLIYPFFEKVRNEYTYSIESGFGIQFVLGLVSLLYAFYVAAVKKDKHTIFVFLIFPVTVFFWLKISTSSMPRYVIFLCSIAAIAIAYMYDHMKDWQKKVMNGLIFYSLIFSFITSLPILIPYQSQALSLYFGKERTFPYEYHKRALSYEYLKWVHGELADAWEWIDKNIKPGSVIAYNYSELAAPLYGKKLQNDIIYIFTGKRDAILKWTPSAGTYEEWKRILFENNVSYFFDIIYFWKPKTICPDSKWAGTHPQEFVKLKGWGYKSENDKDSIVIYKVKLQDLSDFSMKQKD